MIVSRKVYLVSKPEINWPDVLTFFKDEELPVRPSTLKSFNNPDQIIELAARVCYMSYAKGRTDIQDFIQNLLQSKDGSVLEHVNYGFMVTGVSRSLTHELVRHRAGFAHSQRSQRFVDETNTNFVTPPLIRDLERSNQDSFKVTEVYNRAITQAQQLYASLHHELEEALPVAPMATRKQKTDRRKLLRQAARSVLPNATETKIMITANVRAWRHFIEMRASPYADAEIRELALDILKILQAESPLLFEDFVISNTEPYTATPKYSKV